jgi:hypothetical protein
LGKAEFKGVQPVAEFGEFHAEFGVAGFQAFQFVAFRIVHGISNHWRKASRWFTFTEAKLMRLAWKALIEKEWVVIDLSDGEKIERRGEGLFGELRRDPARTARRAVPTLAGRNVKIFISQRGILLHHWIYGQATRSAGTRGAIFVSA